VAALVTETAWTDAAAAGLTRRLYRVTARYQRN
jgi:hypothetical protein